MDVKPLFEADTARPAQPAVQAAVHNTAPAMTVSEDLPVLPGNTDVSTVGASASQKISDMSKDILSQVRASDSGAFGDKLNELVSTAKRLDPNALKHSGMLQRIMNLGRSAKEQMLAQYQSVDARLEALSTELSTRIQRYKKQISDLDKLYELVAQQYQDIVKGIALLTQFREQLEQATAKLKQDLGPNPSVFDARRMTQAQSLMNQVEERLDTLERSKLLAEQFEPSVRLMQDNARSLVTKFDAVQTNVIPAWRNAFTLHVMQVEQQQGAQLATSIHDATDLAFRMQADALRQSSVEIATVRQRSVVSI